MTSLFAVRRRADEFAAAVDGTTDGAGDLAVLVGVVTALRDRDLPAPRPEFAVDLRSRLIAEAEAVLRREASNLVLPTRPRGSRERRLVAAASAVVLIGGTAGMAAASQSALPGEALYPVKRGIERAQAGLSVSPAGKGRDLLHQATARLDEVRGLLADGSPATAPQVPRTLAEFSQQADEGAGLLLDSFRATRDPSSVVAVRTFAANGIATLQRLAGAAPPGAQEGLAAAAVTLRDIDERATGLCSSCAADLPDLQIPQIFLTRAEVDRALQKAGVTRLDNSHPVVADRRAVRKAADAATDRPSNDPGNGPAGVAPPAAPPAASSPTASPSLGAGQTAAPLPDLGEPVKTGQNEAGKVPGQLVGGLTDGVGGVLQTLLPDLGPTPPKLLP